METGEVAVRFSSAMLEPLVRITPEYEIIPALAKSWELSDDGLELTLRLEEDVRWHDGTPFTSADVKFNFEEIVELQTFGGALVENLTAVDTPDEHTVVLTYTQQYGPLLEAISQQFMLPAHVYEGTDYVTNPANMAPVGTGPMVFESYSPGSEVVLLKNEDYWAGEPTVERAIFPIIQDANARALAMLNGEIDEADVDAAQQDQLSDADHLVQLDETSYFPQNIRLMLNGTSEYLSDAEVRKLIFAAIDREAIAELALGGLGSATNGFVHPSASWALHPDVDFDQDFPRDIEAIRAGLDDAGFPVQDDGLRFTLNARYIATHPDATATAEVIRSSLGDIDVGLDMLTSAAPVFSETVYAEGDFDLAVIRTTRGGVDPALALELWFTCNPDNVNGRNPSGLCNEELHDATERSLAFADREERVPHLHTMQELGRDMMIYAPLAWFNGAFPTVNTARWNDVAGPGANMTNWLGMTPGER